MAIRFYNTLTRKKDDFKPIIGGQVSMYVCGVTVYDYCHMGHARAYVAFDSIRRYLEYAGFKVKYVQNFTDIDDKIINRSNENGIKWQALVEANVSSYFEDMDRLNIMRASSYPRATDHIGEMVSLIAALVEKKIAYETDGDVCFSVEAYEKYGQLSRKVLEDLIAGARVEVSHKKRNDLDFVLWKKSKEGEPFWESPWGKGRPGWHIECSAMAIKELGETIDIHGGGADLIFPHHENEIAQSECVTGKQFANYWVHNGFVSIDHEKMSKSKKNVFNIRDILAEYDGEVVRFYLQKVHYKAPLHFSLEGLQEAKQAYTRLIMTLKNYPEPKAALSSEQTAILTGFRDRFKAMMDDDCNTAGAIGVLFDLIKHIHLHAFGSSFLMEFGQVLGLFQSLDAKDDLSPEATALIAARSQARIDKDYAKSDEIRDCLLKEHKIIVEDVGKEVRWRRA
ncbi:MAG: cysteinyl-tRNA synthetase [Candidatus Marinamargulisbacteria bacterium]|jgi:cysteinyl-tRNA synthetase